MSHDNKWYLLQLTQHYTKRPIPDYVDDYVIVFQVSDFCIWVRSSSDRLPLETVVNPPPNVCD